MTGSAGQGTASRSGGQTYRTPCCAVIGVHEEGVRVSVDGDTNCVGAPQVRLGCYLAARGPEHMETVGGAVPLRGTTSKKEVVSPTAEVERQSTRRGT